MQYNKNKFNKVNDKKIMKKVKKQWVVVSVATLAFLGASAYGMMTNSVSASASAEAETAPVSSNAPAPAGGDKDKGQSVINTTHAGNVTADKNDDSSIYANQIQQGYTDAYNNKSNQSSSISGNGANYYNAAYDGAQTTMAAYNSNTQNVGAGTQDYNYYGNTVEKKDDSGNAQTSPQGSNTDGTPQGVNTVDNPNQGGADNPKDAQTSVKNYEKTMDNKLDSASNISVKANSSSQQISIPDATNSSIVSEQNKFNGYNGLLNAFNQAVAYVLRQQGIADAESGKWQGVYQGSNGQTQDYYLNSHTSDTTNVYDQAYRGARDAMNQYFNNNAYQGNTSVSATTNGTTDYQAGYNDVVNQASQGIVYVQNGQQYASVMAGNTDPKTVAGNIANNINTIRLANDIDLTGAPNGENSGTVNTNSATITIDGQNHMMDFHGNNYTINRSVSGSLDVYLQNFQTMYGANYYGTFRAETGAAIHFSNINYVGPQLLSSYNNDTYFSGNVNVIVPINANATYTSPFQSNVGIEGGGNQENLEVKNFILQDNSHYFGNTSPVYGGTNVVATGNFTIGQNAKMTLIPRGGNSVAATIEDGSTWGVYLENAGASLNIGKNATLNIIPDLYNNQKNLFGGAVYAGVQVNINIDGGTLNYEGYKGISGYYNQPVDLQGSNQTQINVINGGVLQVLMDSIPNDKSWYSYNSSQSTYNGLINNVGLGNFNVGSNGNLKVGVTNSDATYNVPYFGPININSVGDNHVIFLKTSTVPMFQTTTGQSGTAKQGEIAAYTVAVKQGDRSKQYLYKFELGSGSTSYTGIDLNGGNVTGTISGNSLEILNVPAVSFVGTLTKTSNSDGSTTVTGYAKLSNYQDMASDAKIYVGVASSSTSTTSYNSLTPVAGTTYTDDYSKADPNKYVLKHDTTGYDGGVIPISYTFAKGVDTTYVGMRLHYGINTVDTILGPANYSTTVEGYKGAGNQQVVETSDGDMQVAGGSVGNLQQGQQDAISDMVSGNTAKKDAEPFTTKTNSDYLATYSSVQAGYQAFMNNNNISDYTKLSSYINSSNPAAFIQGFEQAAYQSGLKDAQFNKDNSTNLTDPAKSQYLQAQNEYNNAYQAALTTSTDLSNPAAVQNFINQNSLPNTNATNQAISDAQGVAAFVKDEQAGTISTSTTSTTRFSQLTSGQQSAYIDAYTGYTNALKVDHQSNNPDVNADKSESAGFNYAQSIINGGLSTTNPTSTTANMNNVTFAQNGFNIARQAVLKAKNNGLNSSDANGIDPNNPSSVTADGSLDVTAYQYIKIGAYTALRNQSDNGLNTMEKVGYSLVASAQAYANGMNAFDSDADKNSDTIPTATDPISTSTVGKPQYNQGYIDAKTAYNQGIADAVANARAAGSNVGNLSEIPASIPANIAAGAQKEYKNAYKAAIDGYQDGNSGAQTDDKGNHYNNTNSDPNYDKSYNSAYNTARADAGANDYLTKHSEAASDTPYVAGYSDASAGHSSGYSAASSAASTSTSVPAANQVNPSATAQYTAGFNGGVSDEQNAANALAGVNDYLANQTMPSGSAFQAGFSAAESGFKAAQAKSSSASSDTNYSLGYAAYSSVASAWSQDETQSGFASASGSANPTTVTNDVFNATVSSLGGKNYTNSQSSQGNLYQDISQTLGSQAATNYSNGVSSAVSSSGASSNDYFTSLGIKDVNDGYNNASNANTQSIGFQKGQSLKQNESNGAQMALNDATQGEPSDPQQKDAFDATIEAYKDVANSGNQPATQADLSGKSRAYQDAYKEAFDTARSQKTDNQNKALSAITSGQSTSPFNMNSASDIAWNNAYKDIKQGYQSAKTSSNPTNPNPTNANITFGFNTANAYTASYQAAEGLTSLPASHITAPQESIKDVDAYNGAVDALNNVYNNGTTSTKPADMQVDATHSADYVKAYNEAMNAAYTASQQGQKDMTSGNSSSSDILDNDVKTNTEANKLIYQNAYNQAAIGFGSGLNSGSYPSNSDRQKGYNYATGYGNGQSLSQGYKDAVNDFMNNKGQSVSSHVNEAGYSDALNALNAANATPTQPVPSSSAISKYAYSQQLAAKNALVDASNNSNANQTVPLNVDQDVYNEAYQAVKDGYKDGVEQTTPTASDHKNQNDSSLPYTASYQQGLTAGRILKGAQDYVAGKANSNVQSTDAAYNQGVLEAQAGYTDGKNNNTDQATANSYPTTDVAYKLGQQAGANSKNGVSQANTTSSNDSGLSGDALNAYYGVKDAYNQVLHPNTQDPSTGKNIDRSTQAYQDAYQNALNDAKQAEQKGVSAFASQSGEPTTDGTIAQDAQKDGYDQAQAGYNDEKTALTNDHNADKTDSNKNSSYNAGVQLAKDSATGQSDAYSGTTPSNATQSAAKQAVLDAYSNVIKGTPDATPTPSDNANKLVYEDAYSAAKTKAVQSASNGADSYLNGNQKSGQSDLDSKLSDAEFDQAQSGFNAGLSATPEASSGNTDIGYNKGFDAGKQVAKAIKDNQSNETDKSNTDSNYKNAVKGYQAALTGNSPQSSTQAYTTAYNQAKTDLQVAYQDGVTQAIKGLPSQSAYDSNKKAANVNGLSNSAVSTKASDGFNDVANGFNQEINNQLGNSQTQINNPNDANNQGTQLAKQVEQSIYDSVSNGSNASFPSNSIIQSEIKQGIEDAKSEGASSTAPSGLSSIAQLAYKEEYNKKTAQEQADIQTAKNHVLSGNTSGDNGNVKTYEDDINQAISNAKIYTDNTSTKSGSDQDAYKIGIQIGQNGLANGAQSYVTGGTKNTDGSVEGQLESQGYTDAYDGFAAGLTKPVGTSTDKQSNTSYTTGFNAAQAVKTVEANIENNTNNSSVDADSANQATQGYKDAVAAFASNPNTSSNETSSNNPAYNQAYSDAINHLQGKYNDGAGQFTSGKATPDTSSAISSYDKNAITQGFNDAQNGFNAGMNNTHDYDSDSNATSAQKNGYDLARKVLDSINSAKNTDNPTSTGDNALDNAIKEARSAVIAQPVSSSDTSYPSNIGSNVLAQQVYKAAVDQFKQEYQVGVTAATSTQSDGSAVNPDHTNAFVTKGSEDANTAMEAGFNDTSNPTELADAYQDGIDAKNGVTEANNGQSVNTNESAATKTGNNAAQTAISNESQNPKVTPDNSGKSKLYQLAYDAGKTQSDNLTMQGTNGFINGQNRPSGSGAANALAQKSYDDALKGYNAAKGGNTSTDNQSDAYKAGVKAYQDAPNGVAYAQQHYNDTSNGIPSGSDVTPAESLAAKATMDAFNGNNPSNSGNPIYNDAYNAEVQKKSQDATEGAKVGANADSDTPESYPSDVLTPLDKAAYAKGYQDAYQGYQAALQDITTPVDTVNSGVNKQDAQNGAVQAFKDILSGGDPDKLKAPSNASDAFKAAYQKALSDAKNYLDEGVTDAKTGTNPAPKGSDAKSQLINYAYGNVTSGYQSQRDNDFSNAHNSVDNTNSYFQQGVEIAKDLKNKVDRYKANPVSDSSLAAQAYQDGISGNNQHKPQTGSDNYLENSDLYKQIHDVAATNADTGSTAFINGISKDSNDTTADDKAQQAGYEQASQGFADGNKVSATPSYPNNPSYMTGYNAGQSAYQVEQNFESGANNSPSDTTSAQQANSAYNQAISDFNTNHAAIDTTTNGNKVYQTVYKHAMDQLKEQYDNGINDFNAGQSSPDVTSIKQSPSSQAARATGFNDANTEFTKVLTQGDGVKTQNPNSAQSAGAQLADKVLGRINEINANNQSPQSTGDNKLDNAIDAAKDAVLTNPNATDTSYPADVTGNNIYQQSYKQAVDLFEAQYAKGVKSTIDPTENSAPVNPFTQKGQTDAENAITAGFNNSDNTNYQTPQVLSDAYTSGQQAKIGMTNGENGQNDQSSSNASYSDKQGNQAALDAIESRQSGQTDDNPSSISSKPKSYQLAYKQAMDDANASAIQGAQSLFANNNQDPTKGAQGGSYQIANPTNSTDKAKNSGLLEASQALTDAQSNSADRDGQYDPNTVAGKVYFATKMAYNNIDPSGVSDYNNKVDVNNDPVAKAAYDAALSNAQSIAKKAAQDYVDGQDNSSDYNGNSIAEKLYKDAHDVNEIAFNKGLNNDNPSGKYTNKYDDPSLTYLAVQNAIADYVNNNNQASAKANNIGIVDSHGVYDKAYQNALAKIQDAVNAAVSEYEAGKTLADISSYGAPNESALGVVAQTAAERAKAGHDDALAGTTAPENASITNDSSYLAGKQYGQQADAGYNTAVSQGAGAPKTNVGPTDDAYDGAIAGYQQASTSDAKNMISNGDLDNYINTNLADKTVAYRDAFKKAYQDGVAKAKSGADAALAIDSINDPDSGKSGAAQKAESQGYSDATDAFLDKLHGVNDTDSTANTPASVAGRDKATQILQAIQDTVDNRPNASNTDSSYQLGLTTAQAAINNAVTDAKAKKSVPANLYDIPVPAGCDPTSYRDVYAAVLDGYNNGYNQRSDQPTTPNTDYDIAYSYAFNKGKASIPTDTSAPTDFLNSQPMPNITDPVVVKAYKQQYDEAQDGFYDALYNKNEQSTNQYYQASYKLAQDGIAGMRLASQGNTYEHRDILKNQSAAFVNGYNGYLKGIEAAKRTLKKNKKLSAKDLLGKDKLYSYTFTEGLKHEVKIQRTFGIKYGTKMALKRHAIPKDIYSHHSESYARAYIATYKKEMRRHMPRYIYNVGTIFTHTHVKFTRHTRIKKYAYSERYNSTVFRVVGVQYYLNRIPRYRLSNGAVVTASQSVQGAYYKKHFNKYRIIKPTGALVHTSKTFRKHNYVRKLYRGEVFKVRKVVKFHGITRLYVGKNEYVTSNKTFVKAIFK